MKNQKGFSLVELLVVVIIIAIIAAIAIPSLLASRRAANEASAISSLRTIHSAQATFFGTVGANTTYENTLGELDDAADGALIDPTLAGGAKSGYNFTMGAVSAVYCAVAVPQAGQGINGYVVSERGVIYRYATPANATGACDLPTGVFTLGAGVAIQ